MSLGSVRTQIGQPDGPRPGHGRPVGVVVGKKRARLLRRAAATVEAINNGPEPAFDGSALSLLQQIYRDPKMPLDLRIACANSAVRFEAVATPERPEVTPEVRQRRIAELVAKLPPPVPEPLTIAGDPPIDIERQLERERMAAENEAMRRRIAEIEQAEAIQRAASGTGFTFKPAVSAPNPYDAAWRAAEAAREAQEMQYRSPMQKAWDVTKLR